MKDEISLLDNGWRLIVSTDRLSSGRSWAVIRPKKGPTGEYYADILFGDRGEGRPHTHLGVDLDEHQSIRFKEGRGTTQSITKRIDSKQRGYVNTQRVVLSNAPPRSTLTFRIIMEIPKKTVRIIWGSEAIKDAQSGA